MREWRDQLIRRATPLASPVTEQVALLAALEQCMRGSEAGELAITRLETGTRTCANAGMATTNGKTIKNRNGVLLWPRGAVSESSVV